MDETSSNRSRNLGAGSLAGLSEVEPVEVEGENGTLEEQGEGTIGGSWLPLPPSLGCRSQAVAPIARMYSLSESLPHIFFDSGTSQNGMHSSLQPSSSSWSKRDDPITLGCEETRQLCFEWRPRCLLRSNGTRLGNDRRREAQRGKTSGSGQVRQAVEQQKKDKYRDKRSTLLDLAIEEKGRERI